MKLTSATSLHCKALFRGIPIVGFSVPEEEMIRAMMSRIPQQLLGNIKRVESDSSMHPKHGIFNTTTKIIKINPGIGRLRQRFGKGEGWIYHVELTVGHEIGHAVYDKLPEEKKDEWRDLSGWKDGWQEGQSPLYVEKRPGWPKFTATESHKPGIKFTRKYAEKSSEEDFADSFCFFMLGKAYQVDKRKREFLQKLIQCKVTQYPKASIESPTKPYGERNRVPV